MLFFTYVYFVRCKIVSLIQFHFSLFFLYVIVTLCVLTKCFYKRSCM